jgi:uncharacterized membrane protein
MTTDQPSEMTWTRHTSNATGNSWVLGSFVLVIAVALGWYAASDGAWGFVALCVFLAAISPVHLVPPARRLVVEKGAVRVRRQPPLRNAALYVGLGCAAAGGVLLVGYSDEDGFGWTVAGAAWATVGVLVSLWGWRAAEFRVTPISLEFADGASFPMETVEAKITSNYRSDDTVTVSGGEAGARKKRRVIALRSQAIHPNTMVSTIEQLRAWRCEGVLVAPATIRAMVTIPDQTDVRVGQSTTIRLDDPR